MLVAIIDELPLYSNPTKTAFYASIIERNQIRVACSFRKAKNIDNFFRGWNLDLIIVNTPNLLPSTIHNVLQPCVIYKKGQILVFGLTGKYFV